MRREIILIVWLPIASTIAGCSEKNSPEPTQKDAGVIPQAQLDALNKAKNVEALLQQERAQQSDAAQ